MSDVTDRKDEPQGMTLTEALMLAAERKWKVTFYDYPYSVLIEDDFGDDIAHEGNWPESFSAALGRTVVERDVTAELVEALSGVLHGAVIEHETEEAMNVYIDRKGWDSAVAALAKVKGETT